MNQFIADLYGQVGDNQCCHIAQHVKRVRDKCHGIGHISHDNFDEEVHRRQHEHRDQTTFFTRITSHSSNKINPSSKSKNLNHWEDKGECSVTVEEELTASRRKKFVSLLALESMVKA